MNCEHYEAVEERFRELYGELMEDIVEATYTMRGDGDLESYLRIGRPVQRTNE